MPSPREILAHGALAEITPIETIGAFVDETDAGDGVVTVRFATKQPGYRGWLWTVSVATVDGSEPTVLEAELLPSDGALLAPEWVPWSERLAEYEASQDAAGAVEGTEDDDPDDDPDNDEVFADDESDDEDDDLDDDLDEDDDEDEDDEEEDDDDDDLGDDDLDGLDIDELNENDNDNDNLDDDDDLDDLDDEPEPASLER